MAVGLHKLGLVPNDIVSCQLPNWWQFLAIYLACSRLGVVFNPLMPIFRRRELRFMLEFAESKLVIVPSQFRGFDHLALIEDIKPDLPALENVLAIGGAGETGFEAQLTEPEWEADPDAAHILTANRPHPDDIMELAYTSGTTGEPKGVTHSANTLYSNLYPFADRIELTGEDIVFMPSPLAHQTGFIYGVMFPIMLGATVVYQDIWNGRAGLDIIQDQGCTYMMGAVPFLADLADAAEAAGQPETLRSFLCAGAPIPSVLVERASKSLGAIVHSGWGMSENGAVTTTAPDNAAERASTSDGCAMPGIEVRVVDESGAVLPPDAEGFLKVRGCSQFGGYHKRFEKNGIDADGWFDTGDIARMDKDGFIRISGRSKDIIIRGGENIPVVEVEQALYKHPAIATAAVVGYPDQRLGERACAFVTLREGASFTFEDMIGFMAAREVAKQYWPEKLEVLPELPSTPSGKIQKFKLRDTAHAFGDTDQKASG
jgi:cyclohexanecarboxylate-CoA ligase